MERQVDLETEHSPDKILYFGPILPKLRIPTCLLIVALLLFIKKSQNLKT